MKKFKYVEPASYFPEDDIKKYFGEDDANDETIDETITTKKEMRIEVKKMFDYAEANGKDVNELTQEEKDMFIKYEE